MKSHDVPADPHQRRPAAVPTRQDAMPGKAALQRAALQAGIDQSPLILGQRRVLQAMFDAAPVVQRAQVEEDGQVCLPLDEAAPVQRQPEASRTGINDTGMPHRLKAGLESLSGMDLSDVRVHRNSDAPAQLNAHAYAQGNAIHLAPGQEQHLPHEAWHVVQQRQGRVPQTMQMAGFAVNDDAALEREADVMGARGASAAVPLGAAVAQALSRTSPGSAMVQRHLFADTPDDFRALEDLGMWWVMACEWHDQKRVRKDTVSKDPKDYITSLGNVAGAKGKIGEDEPIRMVAHGSDPAKGKTFLVGADHKVDAATKKAEIKSTYEAEGHGALKEDKFAALYCFGAHDDGLMKGVGLGAGPLVMPSGNISTFDVQKGVDANTWNADGRFITKAGSWRKASAALDHLPKLAAYKTLQAHDGTALAEALEEVLKEVDAEYKRFVSALTATGSMANPWGV